MPRNLKFLSSKKRAVSFKDEKAAAPTTDVSKNMDKVSVYLPMQRSASLFDLPLQQTPRTCHVFYPNASHQSETETSTQWKIQNIFANSSVAHSKSPGDIANPIYDSLNASSSVNQLSDSSAEDCQLHLALYKILKVSNSKTSTKSGKQIPSLFSPSPSTRRVQTNDSMDTFESFDILNEARKIFRSLSVDISKTFDTIAKSPALPSVIEKYSGSKTASVHDSESSKSGPKQKLPHTDRSCTTPKWRDSLPSSEHEELMEILAALQVRCLEYREMMKDYSESIFAECSRFTESSIPQMKTFSDSISSLSANFSNFKELCKKQLKNAESEGFPNVFTDFMQVMFLHTLEEQNESYLTRLQSGANLIRAHCKFVRYEKAASLRMETLIKELDDIRRISVGYHV